MSQPQKLKLTGAELAQAIWEFAEQRDGVQIDGSRTAWVDGRTTRHSEAAVLLGDGAVLVQAVFDLAGPQGRMLDVLRAAIQNLEQAKEDAIARHQDFELGSALRDKADKLKELREQVMREYRASARSGQHLVEQDDPGLAVSLRDQAEALTVQGQALIEQTQALNEQRDALRDQKAAMKALEVQQGLKRTREVVDTMTGRAQAPVPDDDETTELTPEQLDVLMARFTKAVNELDDVWHQLSPTQFPRGKRSSWTASIAEGMDVPLHQLRRIRGMLCVAIRGAWTQRELEEASESEQSLRSQRDELLRVARGEGEGS